jgi:hypothetical protein
MRGGVDRVARKGPLTVAGWLESAGAGRGREWTRREEKKRAGRRRASAVGWGDGGEGAARVGKRHQGIVRKRTPSRARSRAQPLPPLRTLLSTTTPTDTRPKRSAARRLVVVVADDGAANDADALPRQVHPAALYQQSFLDGPKSRCVRARACARSRRGRTDADVGAAARIRRIRASITLVQLGSLRYPAQNYPYFTR